MKPLLLLSIVLLNLNLLAQTGASQTPAVKSAEDYSGAYFFLKDGELLQLNIEDEGKVTGFIQRFGDTDTDRGILLDHFFKEGKLDGKKLTFNTKVVHGIAYEFTGAVERGEGKKAGDEAFYILKGTLIQSNIDSQEKATTKSQEVSFKSFPQDLDDTSTSKKN